jgi:putative tryptophan/tyrosine transport system substrate-binding protein
MDRRAFTGALLGALGAMPLAAAAQTTKLAQIGFLSSGIGSFAQPQGRTAHTLQALRDALAGLGYVENQTLKFEYRYAEEREKRLPALAAELVKDAVDVIIAIGPAVIRAAKRVTSVVPIVGLDYETDPVAAGFAASFARPSSNITGIFLDQANLTGKWLQLLQETIPKLVRVAVLWDTSTPNYQLHAIERAAKSLALTLDTFEVRQLNDFHNVFAAAVKAHSQGIVILSSPFTSRRGTELAAASLAKRLPTISMFRENVTEGCLLSYGPSIADGVSGSRDAHWSHPEGCQASRPPDSAAQQVGAVPQSKEREGTRPDYSTIPTRASRRDHPMSEE